MISQFFIIFGSLLVGSLAIPTAIKSHQNGGGRIIGGGPAGPMAAPYMAALTIGSNVRSLACVGSIITSRHILTTAACIDALIGYDDLLYPSMRVIVGANDWTVAGVAYKAATYYIHEEYDDLRAKNNIGILTLATDVVMTDRIQIIPLKYDYVGEDVPAIITGWGRDRPGGPLVTRLNELILNTVNAEKCKEVIDQEFIADDNELMRMDPETELCAFNDVGMGLCGDAGSPLTTLEREELIGVASYQVRCAGDSPSVYTRISAYESWIKNATRF